MSEDRPSSAGPAFVAFALLGASIAAPMLVGLLAVDLTEDLALDDRQLGLAISAFWWVTAVAAPVGGRWIDRRGWPVGLYAGALLCTTGLLATAVLARSWPVLLVTMALSGLAYALCSPTSNLLVVTTVPRARRASALALKQTAPPLLTALAGATLPALAIWQGWRTAMSVGLVLPLVAVVGGRLLATPRTRVARTDEVVDTGAASVPKSGPTAAAGSSSSEHLRATRPLAQWRVVVAAGLGTVAVASVTGFSVLTLVAGGLDPVWAAAVVSVGSLLAVVARLASGGLLDRRAEDDLGLLLLMMTVATAALTLTGVGLVLGDGGPLSMVVVVVGVLCSLVSAWTWPALLLLVVVRAAEGAGAASGTLQLGSGVGSAVGPLVFGVLAHAGGRGWAWVFMAACTGVAWSVLRPPRAEPTAVPVEVRA